MTEAAKNHPEYSKDIMLAVVVAEEIDGELISGIQGLNMSAHAGVQILTNQAKALADTAGIPMDVLEIHKN